MVDEAEKTTSNDVAGVLDGLSPLPIQKVKFEKLRAMIDAYLRHGAVPGELQEAWPVEFYQKVKAFVSDLIKKAMEAGRGTIKKATEAIAAIKILVELVRTIFLRNLPPFDP